MSARQARFEIVRTRAGWHGRFRAANGAIVWTTESYERRRGALKAIEVILFCCSDGTYDEIRDVDERPLLPRNLNDAEALGSWAAMQPTVRAEIKADRKIHAIKELRALTGAGSGSRSGRLRPSCQPRRGGHDRHNARRLRSRR